MLRISSTEHDEPAVTLRLEGQIVGPWVDELRKTIEQLLNQGRLLTLDLTEATFADRNGVALLLDLRRRTVSIRGCSPFLNEQLKSAGKN
jgi:ABC-type transporter Mla MlaB component